MRRRGGVRVGTVGLVVASAAALVFSGIAAGGASLAFPNLATMHPKIDGAPAQWQAGYAGRGVAIAIIDTGVAGVSDFGTRLVSVTPSGATVQSADDLGHGTFVAALAAGESSGGRYVGLAPRSRIFAIDVADENGVASTKDIIRAMEWIRENSARYNIRVVNTSFVETFPSSYRLSYLDTAVERLWRAGIVVVASAGNLGEDPLAVSYAPANDPFVITVGASDANGTARTGDDTMASFSSRGTTLDGYSKPDILAPGRQVVSRLPRGSALYAEAPAGNIVEPGYARISGTSFSAPQVAAAAAALLERNPKLTPDQIKWILVTQSRDVSGTPVDGLAVDRAAAYTGTPRSANQGVDPSYFGLLSSSDTSSWSSNSWTSNSWTSNSWTSNSWASNSWTSNSWASNSWTSNSWE